MRDMKPILTELKRLQGIEKAIQEYSGANTYDGLIAWLESTTGYKVNPRATQSSQSAKSAKCATANTGLNGYPNIPVSRKEQRMITFIVYGDPQAQGRPRGTVFNGRVKMYDPASSKDYKQYVSLIASQHRPKELIDSAVSLTVKVYRPIPKLSKVKHQQAVEGILRPKSKPDLSNYIKGVEDALEGVLLKNDSQVVDYGDSGKWYSEVPRIEIIIREVG